MSDAAANPPNPPSGTQDPAQPQGPALHTITQYLKDLSFENPTPLDALSQPQGANSSINVNVTVDAKAVRDGAHEVTLSLRAQAVAGEKTLFLVETSYCGLFALVNIPQENQDAVLRIHCPSLLFPFVRQIVAEAVRNGGFAPLYLNMVDFAAIYQQQQQSATGGIVTPV